MWQAIVNIQSLSGNIQETYSICILEFMYANFFQKLAYKNTLFWTNSICMQEFKAIRILSEAAVILGLPSGS